jgi:hypothetical protein
MNTISTNTEVPTIIGTPFDGGYYAGRLRVADDVFALIVAPKADGEHAKARLNQDLARVEGALSFFDGAANTAALAAAGSELAKWAQSLAIGAFSDWYLPSRDELELIYRAFKPTEEENYCGSGDNPSSVPAGYAYSPDKPARTDFELFQAGGREAFTDEWYWSSTLYAGDESYAWYQDFDDGYQDDGLKGGKRRARAVRRSKV